MKKFVLNISLLVAVAIFAVTLTGCGLFIRPGERYLTAEEFQQRAEEAGYTTSGFIDEGGVRNVIVAEHESYEIVFSKFNDYATALGWWTMRDAEITRGSSSNSSRTIHGLRHYNGIIANKGQTFHAAIRFGPTLITVSAPREFRGEIIDFLRGIGYA